MFQQEHFLCSWSQLPLGRPLARLSCALYRDHFYMISNNASFIFRYNPATCTLEEWRDLHEINLEFAGGYMCLLNSFLRRKSPSRVSNRVTNSGCNCLFFWFAVTRNGFFCSYFELLFVTNNKLNLEIARSCMTSNKQCAELVLRVTQWRWVDSIWWRIGLDRKVR